MFSVIQGHNVTASGLLTDTDSGGPIEGKTITFSGTGAIESFSPAISNSAGSYSSTGASPNTVSDDPLTVQAHFAGDSAFDAAG